MPIYAYRCADCGHTKDVLRKLSDPPLVTCPACGAEAFTKQLTAAGFQLKGSGWYVTDFRNNAAGKSDDAKTAADKPADGKPGDAKPADGKPADGKPADARAADVAKPADAAKPADTGSGSGSGGSDGGGSTPSAAAGPRDCACH